MSNSHDGVIAALLERWSQTMSMQQVDGDEWILQTPFYDDSGDPVKISIAQRNGTTFMDDGGVVAGQLFSMGQHTLDTPGFRLLAELAKSYELEIDFDEGLVKTSVSSDDLEYGVTEFVKVILALITVNPHIRVKPHRFPLGGTRVKTKIRQMYKSEHIFEYVQPNYILQGEAIDEWRVDYRWQLGVNGSTRDVYVIATDLNLREPLQKAGLLSNMVLDVRRILQRNDLRVVIDAHGDNRESQQAANLIKRTSERLDFSVYDFGVESEVRSFVRQSAEELTSPDAKAWRELMTGSVQFDS